MVMGGLLSLTGCSRLHLSFDPNSDYVRPGAYLCAGISMVDENFTAFEDEAHDADEIKPGAHVKAGYRFHPRFAAELALQSYSAFNVELENAKDGDVKGYGWTVNLKGFLATGDFQPYGFLGAGQGKTENSSGVGEDGTDFLCVIGLGADYYVRPNLLLFLEAASYKPGGDTDEFGFRPVTLGIQYRF
jgi:opacity protein-like surface antigen